MGVTPPPSQDTDLPPGPALLRGAGRPSINWCLTDSHHSAAPGYEMAHSCPQLPSEVLMGKFIQTPRTIDLGFYLSSLLP